MVEARIFLWKFPDRSNQVFIFWTFCGRRLDLSGAKQCCSSNRWKDRKFFGFSVSISGKNPLSDIKFILESGSIKTRKLFSTTTTWCIFQQFYRIAITCCKNIKLLFIDLHLLWLVVGIKILFLFPKVFGWPETFLKILL